MEVEEIRIKLRELYIEFTSKYGNLNKQRNKKLILQDSYGFLILASVETRNGNDYVESTVLTKSTKSVEELIVTESCQEAMLWTLSMYGRIDLDKVAAITGKDEPEILIELGNLIYYYPDTNTWLTESQFLSGNVYKKMLICKNELNKLKESEVKDDIYNTVS